MTQFVFYSKSSNKFPGKGSNEILNEDPSNYTELSNIKDWRKMLSNFWVSTEKPLFYLDDKYWASLEHFFHYVKFRDNYPEFANTFTFNGGKPWSRDPGLAKSAGRAGMISREGKVFDKFTRGKGINEITYNVPGYVKVRDDFYLDDTIRERLQLLAGYSKFSQNENLKNALLATKNAELWHYVGRGATVKLVRWHWLEKVRYCVRLFENVCPCPIFNKQIVDRVLNYN